jgi:hypothetical protein
LGLMRFSVKQAVGKIIFLFMPPKRWKALSRQ